MDTPSEDPRARLERLASELDQRLARIGARERHEDGPPPQDFAEQATERENDDVIGALALDTRLQLGLVRKALRRLDAGDYGVCVECGTPIPSARLAAPPWAEHCVACAERLEGRHA